MQLKLMSSRLALYTAGSAIALTGLVPMLVLPHAGTAGQQPPTSSCACVPRVNYGD